MHPSEHLDAPNNVQPGHHWSGENSPTGVFQCFTSINTWRPAYQQSRVYPGAENLPLSSLTAQKPLRRVGSVHEVCTQTSGLRWMFPQSLFNYKIHCQLCWVVVFQMLFILTPYLEKWSNLTICSNGLKPPTSLRHILLHESTWVVHIGG